jgi:formylglycine-generating enzyme required for sulfatase activity
MTLPLHRFCGLLIAATACAQDKPINTGFDFAAIPAGKFELGIHKDKLLGEAKNATFLLDDEPHRYASVARPFLIKSTEVSWAEWQKVRGFAKDRGYTDIGEGSEGYKGDGTGEHPVTNVSWWDAVKWCNLLSEIEGKAPVYFTSEPFEKTNVLRSGTPEKIAVNWASGGYRLPTEAEWEYAFNKAGLAEGESDTDGWHQQNSEGNTHPVGTRPSATSKSLHDMGGNVAEWCWDWIGPVTKTGYDADPKGKPSGTHRMIRGGSWADHPMCCRATYRGDFSPKPPRAPWIGFRPVRMKPATP